MARLLPIIAYPDISGMVPDQFDVFLSLVIGLALLIAIALFLYFVVVYGPRWTDYSDDD